MEQLTAEQIKDLARMSANRQEFETKKDEWHSHYYGYILGFQEGQKQSGPSKLQELMEENEKLKEFREGVRKLLTDKYFIYGSATEREDALHSLLSKSEEGGQG